MITQTRQAEGLATNSNGHQGQDSAPVPAAAPTFTEAPFSWTVRATSAEGFDEMFTVRAMTPQGFFERVAHVKKQLADAGYTPATHARSAATAASASSAPADEPAPVCAIHNTPMQRRQGKNGQSFWSCATKLNNGEWCPYRPPSK